MQQAPALRPSWVWPRWVAPEQVLLAQRGHLFPWTAVCLATGIGLYFVLRFEPDLSLSALVALAGLVALAAVRPLGPAFGPLAGAAALMALGFVLATARAHLVAAPVLDWRYYGPIEGRIVEIDRSASDALRLTLDRVVLDRLAPVQTPARVRVALQGDQPWIDPIPGTTVILTGHLAPPNGPVEPGDFDFRQHAWFQSLGAVGYTRTPVLMLAPPDAGPGLWLARLRLRLSAAVRDLIPGDAGGLAAAVMTGDRSGLSVPASDAMRDANLYHLVSISGLHMGMLVGLVFALVRGGVALVPPLALRISGKKVAAVAALPVAAFYLALAGRDVATERAFVMAAVMLGAVLLDRQALTLRSVAIAALIVLTLRPESLMNPGFQMSFAAVIALVFAYQGLRLLPQAESGRWRWLMPLALLVFSSLVAGLATAPFAAAHFNRIAHFGLIANLLAVPVMGLIVMPGGVMLAILGPLGLTEPARTLIDWGCRWILAVSDRVSATDGAVSAIPAPPAAVLPLVALGALVVILWQGRLRWGGLAVLALAMALWSQHDRPVLLIAASGGLVGAATDTGRALSRAEGEGFVAENWLSNDGEVASQTEAAARLGAGGRAVLLQAGEITVLAVAGERALATIPDCGGADLMVANVAVPGPRPCDVWDPARLALTGAVAGHVGLQGLRLTTVAAITGHRLWAP